MKIEQRLLDFAEMVIAAEVKKLVQRGTIRRADAEDTRGEMMLILMTVWDMYDPQRGTREAFINKVVSTRLVSFLRAKYALKRGQQPQSLDSNAYDVAAVDSAGATDLRLDLDSASELLNPSQREIVDALRRDNVSDAAKELGVPRSTLRGDIAPIREKFYDAGLEEYFR